MLWPGFVHFKEDTEEFERGTDAFKAADEEKTQESQGAIQGYRTVKNKSNQANAPPGLLSSFIIPILLLSLMHLPTHPLAPQTTRAITEIIRLEILDGEIPLQLNPLLHITIREISLQLNSLLHIPIGKVSL